MALKALDIFKHLPKGNCKKCGCPTCLAFAMKLAQKQATLDECPEITADGRAALEGASAPPIRLVTIGSGDRKVEIGKETVMFRHEETFYHPTGVAVRVRDNLAPDALQAALKAVAALKFVRVGTEIRIDLVAVENASGQPDPFKKTVEAVKELGLPLVLMSDQPASLAAALAVCAAQKPLLYAAGQDNWEALAKLAKEHKCPLAVRVGDCEKPGELPEKIKAAGVEELVLDVTTRNVSCTLQNLTGLRRMALRKTMAGIGYPCMAIAGGDDPYLEVAQAATFISKYAALVVVNLHAPEQLLPLLTVRQNLYTDPRKPIQVEAKLYEIGAVTKDSPLLITTNFSLTYYTVEGEVESCRVPAYIGVIDTEGTSVLTAYAADKLTSEKVTAFLKSDAIAKRIAHKKVVLPGYVAAMSGALEDDSGWKVLVGPREASGISKFLKTVWKSE